MVLLIFIGIILFIGLVAIFTGIALIAIGAVDSLRGKEYPLAPGSNVPDYDRQRLNQDVRRLNEIENLNINNRTSK